MSGSRAPRRPEEIEARPAVMALLDEIRRRVGVSSVSRTGRRRCRCNVRELPSSPEPARFRSLDGTVHEAGSHDLATRMLSMERAHRAIMGTGALNIGVASRIEGTIPHALTRRTGPPDETRVGNPSGAGLGRRGSAAGGQTAGRSTARSFSARRGGSCRARWRCRCALRAWRRTAHAREPRRHERFDQSQLRELVERRSATLIPGVANALAARMVEDLGFEAVYLSGAGLIQHVPGLPDLGFVGLPELVQHTAAIRDVVELPIIVDADTGFGNALNVGHTVRALERAGASAVQLEDQVSPKRCGHFEGKSVIPAGEMVQKVRAAADARVDPDFLMIARTDARATLGIRCGLERAQAYVEAGADVTFVEAPESLEELMAIPKRVAAPQVVNMVVGGKTPIVELAELRQAVSRSCSTPTWRCRGPCTACRSALAPAQGRGPARRVGAGGAASASASGWSAKRSSTRSRSAMRSRTSNSDAYLVPVR